VGGESLLGKEVRDLVATRTLPASIRLIASPEDSEDATIITAQDDEVVVLASIAAADLDTARIVLLAGSPESSKKAYERVRKTVPPPAVIDLSGALEENPGTRLRAPMVEPAGYQASGEIQVVAHPASIALALFLTHLRKAGSITRSIVEVFEPASERGRGGIDELQKQTAKLLTFQTLPKDVFDAQISFNMLAQYGSESPHSLADIEQKIDRHLASLLAVTGNVPMPSLRLIQAPVFHGYSISAWVEFESNPGVAALAKALAASNIDVRTKDHEPPTNVGAAGQDGIMVGAITLDRNQPRACWFWIVADNFRIAAENAVEVARGFLG